MHLETTFAGFLVVGLVLCASVETKISDDANLFASPVDPLAGRPKKWISRIMSEAELAFDMDPKVSRRCGEDFQTYKLHIENQTVWAIRMMESSEWPRIGVFSGVTYHLGDWTSCLRSSGPNIRGQYCLVEATYNFTYDAFEMPAPGWIDWPPEDEPAWKIFKVYEKSHIRVNRQMLSWAMCIPSSCTAHDLQLSLENTLRPIIEANNLDISINADSTLCQVAKAPHYSTGYYYAGSFFIFLILLVLSATIYDFYNAEPEHQKPVASEHGSVQLLRCFSALRSYTTLTSYSPNNSHLFLYFIRSWCSFCVVVGHTALIFHGFPKFHTEGAELLTKPWNLGLLLTNIVHIFFLLSGFMTAYKFDFKGRSSTDAVYMIVSTVVRWLRLVPPYGFLALYFTFLSEHMGGGPVWNPHHGNEVEFCKSNWWTTVLAVNNIVNPRGMCFTTSWYISVDIQLSFIAGVLLVVYRRNKKLGLRLMVLTFLYFVSKTFLNIYVNKYHGFFMHLPQDLPRYRDALTSVWHVYASTSFRGGPYLIGLATGLCTAKLKEKNVRFSRMQTIVIPAVLSAVGCGVQLYAFLFYMERRPYDALEHALFGAFHSILLALPIASLLCIYFVSGLGALNRIIDRTFYVPLGRLSYCVYLVSYPIQMFHFLVQRRALVGIGLDVIWWAAADVIFSFAVAFLFFLITEGPVTNMTQLLQLRLLKKYNRPKDVKLDEGAKQSGSDTVPTNSEKESSVGDAVRKRKTRSNVASDNVEEE